MPKKELPKAPFFLFDVEKMITENDATSDLLKEQFFSKSKATNNEDKKSNRGEASKLKEILKESKLQIAKISELFQNLSPSGIELEILSLSTFEFDG